MVTISKILSYIFQRDGQNFTAKVHGNLPWHNNLGTPFISAKVGSTYIIMLCYHRYNVICSNLFVFVRCDDMIRKLQEIGDNRIWIINSEDNIHYFNNFVERVLPTQDEEQREEIEIKKSLKKLAVVLGDSSEDPK